MSTTAMTFRRRCRDRRALRLLQSANDLDRATLVTGHILDVDGGFAILMAE